jgi:SPP1 gp7 family putative phage head morphogenesis protein
MVKKPKTAELKPPDQAEREYIRLLQWYVRQLAASTKKIVLPKLHGLVKSGEIKADSYVDDIAVILAAFLDSIALSTGIVEAKLPGIFTLLAKNNDRALILAVKAATGKELPPAIAGARPSPLSVDLYRGEPWIKDLQAVWVQQNVSLVKSIGTQYHERLTTIIQNGVFGGNSVKQISDQIQAQFDVTKNRATLIAQDQILSANARITRIRAESIGVREYIWRTVNDSRVRPEHADLEGRVFSWDKPPAVGHPGTPIRCLPYHSNIEVAHGCSKLWRRTNTVKATTLITESGKSIEATINHPILTNRGWQPIQNVNVGDYLFSTSNEGFYGFKNDIQAAPIQIGQIFDSISSYVGFDTSKTLPGFEFNGDAIDSEVQTINIDGFLPDMLNSEFIKPLGELFFAVADNILSNTEFSINRPLALSAFRLWYSSDCVVRGFCKLLSLINRESSHSDEIRLAAISNICTAFDKAAAYHIPAALVFFGQSKFALSSSIFCNQFINRQLFSVVYRLSESRDCVSSNAERLSEVCRIAPEKIGNFGNTFTAVGFIKNALRVSEKFDSENTYAHVYNLQTLHSWYTSDSLIIHNCRCRAELLLPDE